MTNFVENYHFNAGKDGCLMRQHFPSFQEEEAKRKYWSFLEYNLHVFRVFTSHSRFFSFIHQNNVASTDLIY